MRPVPPAARPRRTTVLNVAGAVLCGGASRRMGRDKALIEVAGMPIVERVARTLEAAGCHPVVLVGGNGTSLHAVTGRTFVPDTHPGEGPLGGVIDALGWFGSPSMSSSAVAVVVAACDLPDLTVEAVEAVAGVDGAAVAEAGRLHPSLARWPLTAGEQISALFDGGVRSLHEALAAIDATPVGVDARAMRNVNKPGDLDTVD
jgi:molybdopterin-guanine dinucleotide biosynthesis protein A